jgi:sec-independent protein translocase protein TatA
MIFGHLPEILALLLLALLIFGPKRMIEMGSSFGKMFREFRDATREMNWSNLLSSSDDAQHSPPSASSTSQTSKSFGAARASEPPPTASASATVVEGSIEPTKE